MNKTNEAATILPRTIIAYRWDDLLSVFPEDFQVYANEYLSESGDISYGNNDTTIIHGCTAERILYDAWDSWLGAELLVDDGFMRRHYFALLPSLVNGLVAVDG